PLHDASSKFHIGGGRILLALLLTGVLFRQSDVRADSLSTFVSATITGVTLTVTFSGTVTCPAGGGCGLGFTLRDAGTTKSYPIGFSSGASGSTVTLFLNPPAPAAGQALVLDYANGFIGDAAGNPIAPFSNQPVANLTGPPAVNLVSASVT